MQSLMNKQIRLSGVWGRGTCFQLSGYTVSTQWIHELSQQQVSHVNPESVTMYAEVGVCRVTCSTGINGYISSSEAIHLYRYVDTHSDDTAIQCFTKFHPLFT